MFHPWLNFFSPPVAIPPAFDTSALLWLRLCRAMFNQWLNPLLWEVELRRCEICAIGGFLSARAAIAGCFPDGGFVFISCCGMDLHYSLFSVEKRVELTAKTANKEQGKL